jgi:hypothetical protein
VCFVWCVCVCVCVCVVRVKRGVGDDQSIHPSVPSVILHTHLAHTQARMHACTLVSIIDRSIDRREAGACLLLLTCSSGAPLLGTPVIVE